MSNTMSVCATKFHVDPKKEDTARAALLAVARARGDDFLRMFDCLDRTIEQLTLDQLVEGWEWSLVRDPVNKTIIDIQFKKDYSLDEETLFETLGPFVTAGSYIDVEGDSTGGYWVTRYGFTGKRMVELEPNFPPIEIEEGKSEDHAPVQETMTQTPQDYLVTHGFRELFAHYLLHKMEIKSHRQQHHEILFRTTITHHGQDQEVYIHFTAELPLDPFETIGIYIQQTMASTLSESTIMGSLYNNYWPQMQLVPLDGPVAQCQRTAYTLFTQMRAMLFHGYIEHSILEKGTTDL